MNTLKPILISTVALMLSACGGSGSGNDTIASVVSIDKTPLSSPIPESTSVALRLSSTPESISYTHSSNVTVSNEDTLLTIATNDVMAIAPTFTVTVTLNGNEHILTGSIENTSLVDKEDQIADALSKGENIDLTQSLYPILARYYEQQALIELKEQAWLDEKLAASEKATVALNQRYQDNLILLRQERGDEAQVDAVIQQFTAERDAILDAINILLSDAGQPSLPTLSIKTQPTLGLILFIDNPDFGARDGDTFVFRDEFKLLEYVLPALGTPCFALTGDKA